MNLYIYKYNNYYNRMVKKEDALAGYGTPIHSLFNCKDFSPNDGVNTTHVFGSAANNYDGSGDYFIVTDENNEILSRWFIIETDFARNGQWILTLRRDLVVDYYDVIIDAPCFIEKATLTADDPLIFNSENMSVNQIKKKEIPIENNLKTPWVVAYLARKNGEDNYNTFGGQFIYEREPAAPNYALDSIDNYEYSNWLDTSYFICDNFVFKTNYYNENGTSSSTKVMYMQLGPNGSFTANFTGGRGIESTLPRRLEGQPIPTCENPTQVYDDIMAVYNTYNETRDGIKYNTLTNIGDADGFAKLSQEAGKTIKIGDTTYDIVADIEVGKYDFPSTSTYVTPGTALYDEIFEKLIMPSGLYYEGKTANTHITLPFSLTRITLSLKPLEKSKNVSYGFGYTKAITTDAAYEIVAAPLKQLTFNVGGGASITAGGSISLQWFQDLYEKNTSAKVYDVQIVPYIPIDTTDVESYQYTTLHSVDNVDEVHGIAFFLPTSSFSNFYQVDVTLNENVKIGSETELWRITSPNGVGSFDFNPYKNNGWGLVEVDCTLIPINPYIKLNPLFDPEGLYGGDYNDFRGLICGGDFSVSLTSSDWATYQQQNKNFQAVFDRQIQNMEVQNNIARQQEAWGIGSGALSGAAGGAAAGAMVGGVPGAIIGGVVGAGFSLVGGLKDRELNELLRTEGLDYTKDMFGYTLGNIKARSQTLSKTTSYNINNKYFPYIEYYSCTDREKDALAKKIAWNGMTVMAIGNINDYINNEWSYNDITSKGYIKGRIIRIENLEDEFHLLKEISNEIYKGVYF